MCFGSSKDASADLAPKPAQVPLPPLRPQSSRVPSPKPRLQDYAPPPGPPPAHHPQQEDYAPPPGPPPSQALPQEYAPPPGPPPSHSHRQPFGADDSQDYAPPPGPPPVRSQGDYAPPPGPPPASSVSNNPFFTNPAPSAAVDGYTPPPGPPPAAANSNTYPNNPFLGSSNPGPLAGTNDYAPPPGPPPSAKPQHDWQAAVPDTALLPPPPDFFAGFDRSPAQNATEEECEEGERWCATRPPYGPLPLEHLLGHEGGAVTVLEAARTGNVALHAPPFFGGSLARTDVGVWRVDVSKRAANDAGDTCLATYPPLYLAAAHSPLAPPGIDEKARTKKTIYYEVRVLDGEDEVALALGFVAPPYPSFRLPGWHRASLGVHGDDGHRFVNDRWGGKAFTGPFRRGETLGLGMEFSRAGGAGGADIRVQVFLTRDGAERGRWDLREETDRERDLPTTGLEGYHDVCAAVGVYGPGRYEVVFAPERWTWRGLSE
ncbi:hypothetical protein GGS23DRAFT_616853 [Durotheca rogersii]|uniref:uncharacterized protein n=1 Tax=Durotheca rogersii TaxID=419775 RepID=UPI002220E2FB|nr:uncharacterized protein GGS23DRAFT_616853 [Durotheca rogersii]KAI5865722.1 hypothetical protein GGS23DRAFT_616853 [Durotheca rogersii]